MIYHPIPPIFDENSKVLILGSFPSVKSREEGFFYGHKQNRFWKVLSAVVGRETPTSIAEKKELLLSQGIAVWDVIGGCEIKGSADVSIKNAVPNDVKGILEKARIKKIFVNGKTAKKYYDKYLYPILKQEGICLPSTSPANATVRLEQLIEKWGVIKDYI